MSSRWTWSAEHNDSYWVTYDNQGRPVYSWLKDQNQATQQPAAQPSSVSNYVSPQSAANYNVSQYAQPSRPMAYSYSTATTSGSNQGSHAASHGSQQSGNAGSHGRNDSVQDPRTIVPPMPPPVPPHIRQRLPNLLPGTPERGYYEPLDSSYRMRTGQEARQFFRIGRVFAMLYMEAASETSLRAQATENTFFSVANYDQKVFSQIRRFVIVRVLDNFVYACAISTYSKRGTTKPGCRPSEHTIVYMQGTSPTYYQGEYDGGMTKEPIEIVPADEHTYLQPASRLRFGKMYPVEWNVKVKDIGRVSSRHLSKLVAYWKQEDRRDDEPDPDEFDEGDGDETPHAPQASYPGGYDTSQFHQQQTQANQNEGRTAPQNPQQQFYQYPPQQPYWSGHTQQ